MRHYLILLILGGTLGASSAGCLGFCKKATKDFVDDMFPRTSTETYKSKKGRTHTSAATFAQNAELILKAAEERAQREDEQTNRFLKFTEVALTKRLTGQTKFLPFSKGKGEKSKKHIVRFDSDDSDYEIIKIKRKKPKKRGFFKKLKDLFNPKV